MKLNLFLVFIAISCSLLIPYRSAQSVSSQNITVHPLVFSPTVDGKNEEWAELAASTIPLHNIVTTSKISVTQVNMKAGMYGDSVYFLVTWKDSTESLQHKPFIWNPQEYEYQQGPQREDRLALEFAMEGEYSTNWFAGNAFKSDMWHWKASRTNPVGKADDQMTIVSRIKLLRAYQGVAEDGRPIYIQRPWDAGDPIYITTRYSEKKEAMMPKYQLISPNGQGSTYDIDAKGIWNLGYWTVEFRRKLNTGNADDVKFMPGIKIRGGIAVFDESDNQDHAISDNLQYNF